MILKLRVPFMLEIQKKNVRNSYFLGGTKTTMCSSLPCTRNKKNL